MKQYLTPVRLANKIRMTRSGHKGAILVVEGDTDARVYKGFIHNTCMLIPAEGKDNAVKVLEILENDCFKGILAIVDADFWHLDGYKPGSMNFGKKKAETFTAELLEGTLRVAYEYAYFCLTALYRSIREWEKANPVYTVLKK